MQHAQLAAAAGRAETRSLDLASVLPAADHCRVRRFVQFWGSVTERPDWLTEALITLSASFEPVDPAGRPDESGSRDDIPAPAVQMTRADLDAMRESISQRLLDASRSVIEEPQPDGDSIWNHVFADRNVVKETL